MTPRKSMIGHLATTALFASPLRRRVVFALALIVCAILAIFPTPYLAVTTLAPTDPNSLGLSGTLGQLGAVQSVFGNQAAIEVSMRIGDSDLVRGLVADKLNLDKRLGKDRIGTLRWLQRYVDVRSLRGGIIQFDIKLHDADLARDIIATYAVAVREKLAEINRKQTAYKREILIDLVKRANGELATAQAAYDDFRLRSRYSSPQASINAIGERVPQLEDAIKKKQVDLSAARQFFTNDNLVVLQIVAQIDALQAQLAEARSISPADMNSVGRVVRESTEVNRLRRSLDLEQGLYDSYTRYLQGTSVEDLTSSANIRVLEPAYIVAERQYNWLFVVLGVFLFLIAAALEFYQLRPPLGARADT